MTLNEFKTRCFVGNGQWIYEPKAAQVEIFDKNHKSIFGSFELLTNSLETKNTVEISGGLGEAKAQYIVLKIQNYGIIPEGKQGAGNKAWTFIDEIIIN